MERSHPQNRFWRQVHTVLQQELNLTPKIQVWITGPRVRSECDSHSRPKHAIHWMSCVVKESMGTRAVDDRDVAV
jgi:hypothetical protein